METRAVVRYVIATLGETMNDCPYCGFELNRPTHRVESRTNAGPGAKSTGAELINCPDCGEVIDGFSAH